jgi:hypothetical protein
MKIDPGDKCEGVPEDKAIMFSCKDFNKNPNACGNPSEGQAISRTNQYAVIGPRVLPEDRSTLLMMGLSKILGYSVGGNSNVPPPLNFFSIWSSVLKTVFPRDMMVDTVTKEDVLKLAEKLEITTLKKAGITWNGRCAFDICDWCTANPMAKTYIGMSIIKGLQLRVRSPSSMIAHYEPKPGGGLVCQSELEWEFKVCSTCDCALPGKPVPDAKGKCGCPRGLVHMSVKHNFLPKKSTKGCLKPGGWFTKFDRAFREYMTHIRAAILAKKLACCSDWTSGLAKKALSFTPVSATCFPKKENPTCLQDSWNMRMSCRGTVPKTHVVFTSPAKLANKNMVGYCEAAKADARKYSICRGQKLPKVSPDAKAQKEKAAAQMLKTPPVARPAPSGWIDVTDKWSSHLQLGCKKHAWVSNFMDAFNGGSSLLIWKSLSNRPMDAEQKKEEQEAGSARVQEAHAKMGGGDR